MSLIPTRLALLSTVLALACGDKGDTSPGLEDSGSAGTGDPLLAISPDPLDFGSLGVSCETSQELLLENLGDETVTLTGVSVDDAAVFELADDSALPLSILPHASTYLTLAFAPRDEQDYSAELVFNLRVGDEPGSQRSVLGGAGFLGEAITDTWEVGTDAAVDIIFAVDQSGSMEDDKEALAKGFSTMVDSLSLVSSDWQLAVVNDDDGCNRSGILTPESEGADEAFEAAVTDGGGDWTEALLTLATRALENLEESGCNEGLIREDAALHVIVVSDGEDSSTSLGGAAWDENLAALLASKASADLVTVSAIVGPYPGGARTAMTRPRSDHTV